MKGRVEEWGGVSKLGERVSGGGIVGSCHGKGELSSGLQAKKRAGGMKKPEGSCFAREEVNLRDRYGSWGNSRRRIAKS